MPCVYSLTPSSIHSETLRPLSHVPSPTSLTFPPLGPPHPDAPPVPERVGVHIGEEHHHHVPHQRSQRRRRRAVRIRPAAREHPVHGRREQPARSRLPLRPRYFLPRPARPARRRPSAQAPLRPPTRAHRARRRGRSLRRSSTASRAGCVERPGLAIRTAVPARADMVLPRRAAGIARRGGGGGGPSRPTGGEAGPEDEVLLGPQPRLLLLSPRRRAAAATGASEGGGFVHGAAGPGPCKPQQPPARLPAPQGSRQPGLRERPASLGQPRHMPHYGVPPPPGAGTPCPSHALPLTRVPHTPSVSLTRARARHLHVRTCVRACHRVCAGVGVGVFVRVFVVGGWVSILALLVFDSDHHRAPSVNLRKSWPNRPFRAPYRKSNRRKPMHKPCHTPYHGLTANTRQLARQAVQELLRPTNDLKLRRRERRTYSRTHFEAHPRAHTSCARRGYTSCASCIRGVYIQTPVHACRVYAGRRVDTRVYMQAPRIHPTHTPVHARIRTARSMPAGIPRTAGLAPYIRIYVYTGMCAVYGPCAPAWRARPCLAAAGTAHTYTTAYERA
jgi:hypothetical protein